MIDFSKLGKPRGPSKPTTLIQLFEQLDRKATHNSLRPVQIEALEELDRQIGERDVLLKVSTGSGKTLVGLVYAEFMRRKYSGELSLYLCPTNQLADQVAESADSIGVEAEQFSSDTSPHRGLQGNAVLVCTYDRLFNALNTFSRNNIVPSSIVLDDVHSGVDKIRQKYTLRVPGPVYDQLRNIFRPVCESTDPMIWRGIMNNETSARYEVPYWLWVPQHKQVAELLEAYKDDQSLCFEWSNMARYLEYARLCLSGTAAELSLPVAAVEENPAYNAARHRLFMSASIKEGSPLLRDVALDRGALARIVQPPSDRGAGERMILPAALIDPTLSKSALARLCGELSKSVNVVVLTSSTKQASLWTAAGATFRQGGAVDSEILELRNTKRGKYVVFAQRYDGVDLPDDACRVLVIDGIPIGDRLCDLIDNERQKNSPGYNARTVNRFEQALGRAVRSSADYAAVLLVGSDIAAFIGRKDVKDALEPHTTAQIELGQDVAGDLKGHDDDSAVAIRSAIDALVSRQSDWKDAHRERIAAVGKNARTGSDLTIGERAAIAERQAWKEAKARNHQRAFDLLQAAVDDPKLHQLQRAELMFRAAGYLYMVDKARAAALYQSAFHSNSLLPRPAETTDKRYGRIRKQAANMREYLQAFTSANAALARLEEIQASLAYAGDAENVERALLELGEMLGATSSRPEKETGRGPDVLWIFDTIGMCIEAKNEKTRPIFKKDAEQLLLSLEWCKSHVDGLAPAALIGVFATDNAKADRPEDISYGPRVMSEGVLFDIVGRLRTVLTSRSYDGPLFNNASQIDQALKTSQVRGEDLVNSLTKLK